MYYWKDDLYQRKAYLKKGGGLVNPLILLIEESLSILQSQVFR